MNISELMVGDWVNIRLVRYNLARNKSQEYIEPRQVVEVGGRTTISTINGDLVLSADASIEPIPLTREILLDNGFIKKKDYAHYCLEDKILLDADGSWDKWNWVVKDIEDYDCYVCSINYVHELQHAMRLCKIDKELKVDGRRRKKVQ